MLRPLFALFCCTSAVILAAPDDLQIRDPHEFYSDPSKLVKNLAKNFPRTHNCSSDTSNCTIGAIDLVFVLDESSSIGQVAFSQALNFLARLTDSLNIGNGPQQSHVGMVKFNAFSHLVFHLDRYTSNSQVRNAILGTPYGGGDTCIGCGMNGATNGVFIPPGDRPNAPNVMIVMTDGQDNSDVTTAHNHAIAKGIDIYAIGVGTGINMQELRQVTGDPSKVYTTHNFGSLQCILVRFCQTIQSSYQPPMTTQPAGPGNQPRPCACTVKNTWLDIVLVIDASAGNPIQDYAAVKSVLYQYLFGVEVNQNQGDNGVRLGIIYFANNVTVMANLTAYSTSAAAASAVLHIPYLHNELGHSPGNVACALNRALEVFFINGGNRPNVPDLMIFVGPNQVNCTGSFRQSGPSDKSYADCGDPCPTIDRIKRDHGVTVLTIATKYQQGAPPPLPIKGTPCFALTSDHTLTNRLPTKICQANCFCRGSNFYQFTSDCVRYSDCVTPVIVPNTWFEADAGCSLNGHWVADIFSSGKDHFLRNLMISGNAGFFGDYWTGLNNGVFTRHAYSWTRGPGVPGIPVQPNDYNNWAPGFPNDADGHCVMNMQHLGFSRQWTNQDCLNGANSKNYFCQKNSCDTDHHNC